MATNTNLNYSIMPMTEPSEHALLIDFIHEMGASQITNRFLFKEGVTEEQKKRRNALRSSEGMTKKPDAVILKAVDNQTGDIIGVAVIELMKKKTKEEMAKADREQKESMDKGEPETNQEFRKKTWASLKGLREEQGGMDHYKVDILAIKEKYRGAGVGSAFIDVFKEKAKEAGLPVYLWALPTAKKFYLKNGFKVTQYSELDLAQFASPYEGFGPYRYFGMIYE